MGCWPNIFSGNMSKRLFDVFESILKYQKFKSVYHILSKLIVDIMQYFIVYDMMVLGYNSIWKIDP